MANPTAKVVGGVDAHTDEHHVAVVDQQGRLLGATAFPTTAAGYTLLISWLRSHGEVERVGVESTGAYAAGLVRALRAGGITVVEVNQPHRHARQRLGKSDPIDAELAARAALSHTATAVPKQTSGIVEAIRQLHIVRTSALKARHAALQQLNDLIVTAPEQLRSDLRQGRTMRARAALCRKLRPDTDRLHDPAQAAKLAAASPAASTNSTVRSTTSTASSSGSCAPQPHAPHNCLESARKAQANSSSPPARTSIASTAKQPSQRSAAPPRSKQAPAAPTATGSTQAATGKPTEHST